MKISTDDPVGVYDASRCQHAIAEVGDWAVL